MYNLLKSRKKGAFVSPAAIASAILTLMILSGKSGAEIKKESEMKIVTSGLTVKDREGKDILLDSLWENRPVVLTFIRHFG